MFSVISVIAAAGLVLTNAAEIATAVLQSKPGISFSATGTVATKSDLSFSLGDDSGSVWLSMRLYRPDVSGFAIGDIVTATGSTCGYDRGIVLPECRAVKRIASGIATPTTNASITAIMSGLLDYRSVRVTGTIREVFQDETEPNTLFIALVENGQTIYLTLIEELAHLPDALANLRGLIDTRVAVIGFCTPFNRGYRRMIGRTVSLNGIRAVTPIGHTRPNPFLAAEIDDRMHFDPSQIAAMGRRRTNGQVIAVCADGIFYIRDTLNEIRRIKADGEKLPRVGETVETVGFPETDLYRINLTSAIWRRKEVPPPVEKPPQPQLLKQLFLDDAGNPKIAVTKHGQAIRVTGTLLDNFSPARHPKTFSLVEDGLILPVDATAFDDDMNGLATGCRVEATGVCIVNSESWNPCSSFPHVTGMTLAIRRASDIRILSRPPWWTPRRTMSLLAALVVLVIGFAIWNRVLNRHVKQAARELLKEEIAHVEATLKVDERTRLAVELHDSLSQTLTGVSFQLDAVEKARLKNPAQIGRYLEVAQRTLESCREEVRTCIWDLRNRALEEKSVAEAIRKTLAPCAPDVILACDIPRARLSDNTLHSILCIIREAVTNAVRHGYASHIDVAAAIVDNALTVTVRDNGCGFDPKNRPGLAEGHFGLLGIEERTQRLGGTFELTSVPGRGTTLRVSIKENRK